MPSRPATAAPPDLRVIAQFLIVTLIWGSTWLVIRTQLGIVPPAWSVAYRFLLAAAVMIAFCIATGRSLRLEPAGRRFALTVAVLQFAFNFNAVYQSERYLPSGLVAVVFALLVVANAGFAWLFLKTPITRQFAAGATLGVLGVAAMFARDLATSGGTGVMIGIGFVFAGVISASLANVLQATRLGRTLPLEATLATAMLYGGVLDAAAAWLISGPPVFDVRPVYLAGLVYLAVVASVIAFSLYYALIRAVGPGRAAYTGVIIPLVALALSTVFEGYRWSWSAALGALLALSGLAVALRGRDVS